MEERQRNAGFLRRQRARLVECSTAAIAQNRLFVWDSLEFRDA